MALAMLMVFRIRKSNQEAAEEAHCANLEKSNFTRSTSASFISIPKLNGKK